MPEPSPECGGSVNSAAPACPHCGHPNPGRPVAPAGGSHGGSVGWIIAGVVVAVLLGIGLLGLGVYRVLQRVNPPGPRHPEEIVDFDSVPPRSPGDTAERVAFVDSVRKEMKREHAGLQQPPDSGT